MKSHLLGTMDNAMNYLTNKYAQSASTLPKAQKKENPIHISIMIELASALNNFDYVEILDLSSTK